MAKRFWPLLLLLAGCTATRVTPPGEGGGWSPLPPASLGQRIQATQVLRGAFAEREATLNCVVSVDARQMTVVGLTALGIRAFTIKYDGANVTAESQVPGPEMLPPERLLNDVQLAYWPLKALQAHLHGSAWEVSEPFAGTRRLKHDGRVVTEVHYAGDDPWNGRMWLVNLQFGYTLNIESKRTDLKP